VESLELRNGHEDDNRFPATLDIDFTGGRDLEGPQFDLEVGSVSLEVEESLADSELGLVRSRAIFFPDTSRASAIHPHMRLSKTKCQPRSIRSSLDFAGHCRVRNNHQHTCPRRIFQLERKITD
jgi:hypothetical protein